MFDIFRFLKRAGRSERRPNKPRKNSLCSSPYHRRLLCETLETRTLLSVSLAALPAAASSAAYLQEAKLVASDGAAGAVFGNAVAISGNTVVVAAAGATAASSSTQGEVYVFTEGAAGWSDMTETAQLTPSDNATGDAFGSAVAISGSTIVVTATATTGWQGAAYVYTEPASGWTGSMTQTAKLTASDGAKGDGFGGSVAIDGNTVVVGASGARWAPIRMRAPPTSSASPPPDGPT